MSKLEGKTIVIAGATGDAGRATASAMLEQGANLVMLSTSSDQLTTMLEDLEQYTPRVRGYLVDASSFTGMTDLADSLSSRGVLIDGFVNLIGGWRPTPIGSVNPADLRWLNSRLVESVASSINAFGDVLRERGGKYVLVSTPNAEHPTRNNAGHGAAKAAAESWVRSLAGHFTGSQATAHIFVVTALVNDRVRYEQPDRGFKNATETTLLAEHIAELWEIPLENGSRTCL